MEAQEAYLAPLIVVGLVGDTKSPYQMGWKLTGLRSADKSAQAYLLKNTWQWALSVALGA